MNSYPDPETVRSDLGDKFLNAVVSAVDGAREDLGEFQRFRPEWYAAYSKRFVANFIHERVFARVVEETRHHAEVTVVDEEPTRHIHHGTRYEMRVKRHDSNASISTYPTRSTISFWTADTYLPDLEKVSLALGYVWDSLLGEIKGAVMSFRDGKDNPVWMVEIIGDHASAGGGITFHPIEPMLPQLDLGDLAADDAAAEER